MMLYKKRLPGFALLEIALALTMLGFLLAGVVRVMHHMRVQQKRLVLQKKREAIFKALGVFVKNNGYLPCPAPYEPSSAMPSATYGRARNMCLMPELLCGGVPFRTLGLPESATIGIQDMPLIYAVNPCLTEQKIPGSYERTSDMLENNRRAYCSHRCSPILQLSAHPTQKDLEDPVAVVIIPFACDIEKLARWSKGSAKALVHVLGDVDHAGHVHLKGRLRSKGKIWQETQKSLLAYYSGLSCSEKLPCA